MGSSKATSDFRRRRKENLVKVCGNKCNLCNYNKDIGALEFHHIDKTQKLYGISKNGTCHDLEKDLKEVKKCILVCANCHREIHSGNYSIELLMNKKIFNEDFANDLRKAKKKLFEKTIYRCKNCNKPIEKMGITGLCEKCYKESLRLGRPSREELKDMIRNMSFVKIGEKFKVSDNAIRKWCDAYSLPRTKTEINKYSDEEWQNI